MKKLYLTVVALAFILLFISSCSRTEPRTSPSMVNSPQEFSANQNPSLSEPQADPATQPDLETTPTSEPITPSSNKPKETAAARLADIFPAKNQRFTIRPDKIETVVGEQGTRITIPAGALVTASGNQAQGAIEVRLQEYYSPADIIAAGLSTLSGDRLLQTGGMVEVRAFASGEELQLRPGKQISIEVPTATLRSDMMPFQGVEMPDGRIDWQSTQDSSDNQFTWDERALWEIYGSGVIRPVSFPGGDPGMLDLLSRLSEYPEDASGRDIEGDAELTFTVNADGHVRDIRVGKYDFPSFGYEAVEILREMRFCPAFGVSGKFVDRGDQRMVFHFPLDSSALGTISRSERKALTEKWSQWKTTKGVPRSYLDPILAEVERKLDSLEDLKVERQKQLGRQRESRRKIIAYYKINLPTLGWCNLDRFFENGSRASIIAIDGAATNGAIFMAYVEIQDYSSYINMRMNPNTGNFSTGAIPEGTQIRLIGIDTEGDQWKMAHHSLLAENTRIVPDFKPVSEGELKQFLESL